MTFCKLVKVLPAKVSLVFFLFLVVLNCCALFLIRQLFAEIFCVSSYLDDSGFSFPCFSLISQKGLNFDSDDEKTQLVSLNCSNNSAALVLLIKKWILSFRLRLLFF